MSPDTYKRVKCPSCASYFSIRVPEVKAGGTVAKAGSAGAGAGIVGMIAEWGVEFPGPLTIAMAAYVVGLAAAAWVPQILGAFGGDE